MPEDIIAWTNLEETSDADSTWTFGLAPVSLLVTSIQVSNVLDSDGITATLDGCRADTSSAIPAEYHRFLTVYCLFCGKQHKVAVYCGNRFCNVCGKQKRMKVKRHLDAILNCPRKKKRYGWKFITLTIPTSPNLHDSVALLLKSFRKMRQRPEWKSHVDGGAAVIEVTLSKGYWHAHLHMLAFSRYWAILDLSREWRKCSPGYIVGINEVRGNRLTGYLTKYLTKDKIPFNIQMDMSEALKGRRLFFTFGSFYHDERALPKQKPVCPACQHDQFGIMEFELNNFLDRVIRRTNVTTHPPPPLTVAV